MESSGNMAGRSTAKIARKAEQCSGWCFQRRWPLLWRQFFRFFAVIGGAELIRTIDTIWTRIALGLVIAQIAAAVCLKTSTTLTGLGDTFPCLLALLVMLAF